MKPMIVNIPSIREPLRCSPGFRKKGLSDFKLDICGLCQFGCTYCSSNLGDYQGVHQKEFANLALQQIGLRLRPNDESALMHVWPDVLTRLEKQLANRRPSWGKGLTCVFSMLTDGFSPELVRQGTTEEALRLVLSKTSFRIRVLTKNAIVGTDKWIEFFNRYPGRFVVGLSIGTIDDEWSRKIEIGTSAPSARIRALNCLQQAGIPTFGMLCPVFPDMLSSAGVLESLIDAIQPRIVEHVWAEVFNNRQNWQAVREGYRVGSPGYDWFTDVFEKKKLHIWSGYASDLYLRLRAKAEADGWMSKLRYLLYEYRLCQQDAECFRDLNGVLIQSKPGPDGRSRNEWIAEIQRSLDR